MDESAAPIQLQTDVAAPAGWYADLRSDGTVLRYWSGTEWTAHTSAAVRSAPASVGAIAMQRKNPLIAFVLVFLFGAFGLLYLSGKSAGVGVSGVLITVLVLGMFTIVLLPVIWLALWIYAPLKAVGINRRIDRAEARGVTII